jgi:predicted O-linked N-acetylglucosamine transferase (SPINDLY family)
MDMMAVKLSGMRLAPVQATSWGHPETSGLPTMDYYLSADLLEPAGAEDNYTERLVRLPNLGCFYEERPAAATPVDLARFGIEPGTSVFVCPGTPFKYVPEYDWVLPAIARSVQRCRFVFFTYRIAALSEKLRARLQTTFAREGLEFDRYVSFVPWLPREEFYGLMKQADVFLDTIGFSGFNTALQAVECNLPIVTREGRFMRGRLASGILKQMKLPELIVDTEQEYAALASRLALDAGYRTGIRQRMAASRAAVYRDTEAVRALEDFLSKAVGR